MMEEESEIELTPFQDAIHESWEKYGGRIGHNGRNSVSHLKAAWKIRKIDPAMAALRAITAEEEAAHGLFMALRNAKYVGSEKLSLSNHLHKSALWPFFVAMSHALSGGDMLSPTAFVDSSGRRPTAGFRVPQEVVTGEEGEGFYVAGVPLDFLVRKGPQHSIVATIERHLMREGNTTSIESMLKSRANIRNRILYASDLGIPKVVGVDGFIRDRQRSAFAIMFATLLVLQSDRVQMFAQQALDWFLKILGRVSDDEDRYSHIVPSGWHVFLEKIADKDIERGIRWAGSGAIKYRWLNVWRLSL